MSQNTVINTISRFPTTLSNSLSYSHLYLSPLSPLFFYFCLSHRLLGFFSSSHSSNSVCVVFEAVRFRAFWSRTNTSTVTSGHSRHRASFTKGHNATLARNTCSALQYFTSSPSFGADFFVFLRKAPNSAPRIFVKEITHIPFFISSSLLILSGTHRLLSISSTTRSNRSCIINRLSSSSNSM